MEHDSEKINEKTPESSNKKKTRSKTTLNYTIPMVLTDFNFINKAQFIANQ